MLQFVSSKNCIVTSEKDYVKKIPHLSLFFIGFGNRHHPFCLLVLQNKTAQEMMTIEQEI